MNLSKICSSSLTALFFLSFTMFFISCGSDESGVAPCIGTEWYRDADNDGLGDPRVFMLACEQPDGYVANYDDTDDSGSNSSTNLEAVFEDRIRLDRLENYAGQAVPPYINQDNTDDNPITNAGATLGRVLFYDTNLSVDNSVSCASCHKQSFAFGDDAQLSEGVNGATGRHSMRLVNARFAEEVRFFWDERAATLEEQTTMPIQDHAEMGFSGQNGDPDINDLIAKLEALEYYQELFAFVYGDAAITEGRMQLALAQFIRSIQSFDSRYDAGFAQVNNPNANFPNFSQAENRGKALYMRAPQLDQNGQRIGGGAGCQGCHRAPAFDIAPNSRNNGVVATAGDATVLDLTVTRSPTLRDLVDPDGAMNGQLMHNGFFGTLEQVIDHYNAINATPGQNNNLDPRLRPRGTNGQQLQLSDQEKSDLVAFLKTLSGTDVYTNVKWSDPF
ncbi:MAG: cytochrome c peroxidase [Bacteroidota bacterium]